MTRLVPIFLVLATLFGVAAVVLFTRGEQLWAAVCLAVALSDALMAQVLRRGRPS